MSGTHGRQAASFEIEGAPLSRPSTPDLVSDPLSALSGHSAQRQRSSDVNEQGQGLGRCSAVPQAHSSYGTSSLGRPTPTGVSGDSSSTDVAYHHHHHHHHQLHQLEEVAGRGGGGRDSSSHAAELAEHDASGAGPSAHGAAPCNTHHAHHHHHHHGLPARDDGGADAACGGPVGIGPKPEAGTSATGGPGVASGRPRGCAAGGDGVRAARSNSGGGGAGRSARLEARLDSMLAEFVLKAKREQRIRQLYPPPLDIGW